MARRQPRWDSYVVQDFYKASNHWSQEIIHFYFRAESGWHIFVVGVLPSTAKPWVYQICVSNFVEGFIFQSKPSKIEFGFREERIWVWALLPVTVTTRIITCLVGHSCKPSFATVTARGATPNVFFF